MNNPSETSQEFESQWSRVRARLKSEVGEAAFNSWLKPLSLLRMRDGEVVLAVPTRFMRDWVVSHYSDRLRSLGSDENPSAQTVNVLGSVLVWVGLIQE